MTIYFSASHRMLDKNADLWLKIIKEIRASGLYLCADWLEGAISRRLSNSKIDYDWMSICYEAEEGIRNATAVIVESSGAAAFGNGYQLALSLALNKPTLALIRREEFDDSYASGLQNNLLTIGKYNEQNVGALIRRFIKQIGEVE